MPDPIKEHPLDCDECRELTKESKLEVTFRKVLNTDVRRIIKEEWQTTVETVKRVDRIEKILTWLIVAQSVEVAALILLIVKIFQK